MTTGISAQMGNRGETRVVAAQYLNTDAAAAFLNLSRDTLAGYCCAGRGPAFRKKGKRVLYRLSDLIGWAESGASKSANREAA